VGGVHMVLVGKPEGKRPDLGVRDHNLQAYGTTIKMNALHISRSSKMSKIQLLDLRKCLYQLCS
jgi:hypothetical protein